MLVREQETVIRLARMGWHSQVQKDREHVHDDLRICWEIRCPALFATVPSDAVRVPYEVGQEWSHG